MKNLKQVCYKQNLAGQKCPAKLNVCFSFYFFDSVLTSSFIILCSYYHSSKRLFFLLILLYIQAAVFGFHLFNNLLLQQIIDDNAGLFQAFVVQHRKLL